MPLNDYQMDLLERCTAEFNAGGGVAAECANEVNRLQVEVDELRAALEQLKDPKP